MLRVPPVDARLLRGNAGQRPPAAPSPVLSPDPGARHRALPPAPPTRGKDRVECSTSTMITSDAGTRPWSPVGCCSLADQHTTSGLRVYPPAPAYPHRHKFRIPPGSFARASVLSREPKALPLASRRRALELCNSELRVSRAVYVTSFARQDTSDARDAAPGAVACAARAGATVLRLDPAGDFSGTQAIHPEQPIRAGCRNRICLFGRKALARASGQRPLAAHAGRRETGCAGRRRKSA
jgi:hypothetical protein